MPAETLPPYVDGWLGSERESSVVPKPQFPFSKNPTPDTYSRLYERMYFVEPRLFLPKIANRTAWSNLLTYSEQLDNAAWAKTNLTATANAGTAPDGQTTLDKLLETVTNGEHSVTQAATVTAAPTEVSVFAVGGLTRLWIRLAFIDSAATTFSAFFNIASGYLGTKSAGVTARIVALGNNQFRCVIQFTPAAGSGTFKANVSTDGATISYAGTITNGVYLWGAQVTTGTETPYISTTTATRAISAPDRDKVDPMAYLIDEDDPNIETSASAVAHRVFGRIPNSQTVPSSMFVTKPDVPGTFPQVFGDFRLFQPVSTVASYDAYSANTVTSDSGAPGGSSFYPAGGTYTATFAGSTSGAIAFGAVAGTVQTALNALTPVSNRGNCVVTGAYNTAAGFTVTFNDYAVGTMSTASLTGGSGSAISAAITSANGGYTQAFAVTKGSLDDAGFSFDTSLLTWSAAGTLTPFFQQYTNNSFLGTIGRTGTGFLTGGTFTITLYGQTTAAIAWNASPATVLAAMNLALTNATARGTIAVTGSGFTDDGTFTTSLALARQNTGGTGRVYLLQFSITPKITGGTYTVTLFGQTTAAIAYNAAISAISTAINALSEVTTKRGGCIVTGAGYDSATGTIVFSLQFSNALIAIDISALTPAGCTATIAIADGGVGKIQTINFAASTATRTLYAQDNGIAAGDAIYVKADGVLLQFSGTFTAPDNNIVILNLTPGMTEATATAITEMGPRTTAGYKPGTALTRINRVTAFYLPGVSPGITTADDIPLPVFEGDPATLLAAIFAQETAINYQVGDLEPWRGPILQRTITTLNATQL